MVSKVNSNNAILTLLGQLQQLQSENTKLKQEVAADNKKIAALQADRLSLSSKPTVSSSDASTMNAVNEIARSACSEGADFRQKSTQPSFYHFSNWSGTISQSSVNETGATYNDMITKADQIQQLIGNANDSKSTFIRKQIALIENDKQDWQASVDNIDADSLGSHINGQMTGAFQAIAALTNPGA